MIVRSIQDFVIMFCAAFVFILLMFSNFDRPLTGKSLSFMYSFQK